MNIFTCKQCGREFQGKIHETICPICTDTNLFLIAKDVIRENDINEFQLADVLDIPISQVRGWIKEGKITYKTTKENKMQSTKSHFCAMCGEKLSFGTVCTKCIHRQKTKIVYNGNQLEKEHMRYLHRDKKST